MNVPFLPASSFVPVLSCPASENHRLQLVAQMCRANCLAAIKLADPGIWGPA